MAAVWIGIAFLLGLGARQLGLPPLIGYLLAGFVLFGVDVDPGPILDQFSSIGITLLLFTIGLKLRIDTIVQPRVWGVSALHMAATSLLLGLVLYAIGRTTLAPVAGIDLPTAILVGFALSFSSTVFGVKVLEDKGEMASTYGRMAIGILIAQDIAAVFYLGISTGKVPPLSALLLLAALFPIRWLLLRIMDRAGHEELLILFGMTIALGGAQLFDQFGIKGDLGALIFGFMLASHRWSPRLAKALLGFKDLFLVGFFLSIGTKGLPGADAILLALLLIALLPLKTLLFFWMLATFRLRARTAFLASLNLSSYSEFGLIVAAIAAANGLIADPWLTIIAVALALSFVIAAPFNTHAHDIYVRYRSLLLRWQHPLRLPDEAEIDPGDATVLIFGMGRVGTGAYETLHRHRSERVIGFDMVPEVIELHRKAGRHVIRASATDADFWSRLKLDTKRLRLVMLAMPQCEENVFAAAQLLRRGYKGRIAALAKFEEEVQRLKEMGVHSVFNLYAEAGAGFAEDAITGVEPLEVPEVSQ
jgi:predicted Kef-type K+ transport protein